MDAWQKLSRNEDLKIWQRFEQEFSFNKAGNGFSINEPTPAITYSISSIYGGEKTYRDGDEDILWRTRWYRDLEDDLNAKTLASFCDCTLPHQWIYALNWQHPSYYICPHSFLESEDADAWEIPVIPNGDYYVFLSEDFSWGIFGHPWDETVCVFGQILINALKRNQPLLFRK